MQCVMGKQPNDQNTRRLYTPKQVIFCVENVLPRIQLRTCFVESYTPYMQCQSTTRNRYTETGNISFVPVLFPILEWAASAALCAAKKTYDVALIQEPWICRGPIRSLKEVGGELIYSRSTLNPRTCTLIKKGLRILPLMNHCSRDLTAVRIKTSSGGGRSFSDRPISHMMTLHPQLPENW
jgi:hypothetical protein